MFSIISQQSGFPDLNLNHKEVPPHTPTRRVKIEKTETIKCCLGFRETRLLYNTVVMQNGTIALENCRAVSYKVKHTLDI